MMMILPFYLLCFFSFCFSGEICLQNPIGENLPECAIGTGINCIVDYCIDHADIEAILALKNMNRQWNACVINRKNIYPIIADHCIKHNAKLFGFVAKQITKNDSYLKRSWNYFSSYVWPQSNDDDFVEKNPFLFQCAEYIFNQSIGKSGFSSLFDYVSEEKRDVAFIKETIFGSLLYLLLSSNYFFHLNPMFDMIWKVFFVKNIDKDSNAYVVYVRMPEEINKEEILRKNNLRYFCERDTFYIANLLSNKTGTNKIDTFVLHIDDPCENGKENATTQALLLYFMSLLQYKLQKVKFDVFHNLKSINFNEFFMYILFKLEEKPEREREAKIDHFILAVSFLPYFKECEGFSAIKEFLLKEINFGINNKTLQKTLKGSVNRYL
jgi:hypothetical protein